MINITTNVNSKVHWYKYLHESMTVACGYHNWVVWWDDGYNWNQLYTGDGYHSIGLKICDREHVQGFSYILIKERVKYITDTMEYALEENKDETPQD